MLKKDDFKAFNEIHASNELKENILNKTIRKKEEYFTIKKIPKFALTLIIIFGIALIGCGGVLASDLIQKYILREKEVSEGVWIEQFVEITEGIKINDNNVNCDNVKNLAELEERLGIEFVFDTKKYNTDITRCDITYNEEGKIESVNASIYLFYDFPEYNFKIIENYRENLMSENVLEINNDLKTLSLEIRFMTEYASEKTKEEFANLEVQGRFYDNYRKEYFLSNIATYGFYTAGPGKYVHFQKEFCFVHNNIFYRFVGNHPTNYEEILEILESF